MSHQSNTTTGALTVLFDGQYWVGVFERTDEQGYSVAKYIFGKEPREEDVYQAVLHEYHRLRFTQPAPVVAGMPADKPMNFKQRQRTIERLLAEMESTEKADDTKAALRAEQQAQQRLREHAEKLQREAEEERQYRLRQEKRREKRRGH